MIGLLGASYSSYSGYSSYPGYTSTSSAAASSAVAGTTAGIFGLLGILFFIVFVVYVVEVIGMWKVFVKAGIEGWKSLIPIYNLVLLYKLVGLNPLLILTALIPCVGGIVLVVITYIAYYRLALAFGKSTGFAIGLMFLTPIFMCILGFGKAEFQGVPESTSTQA